MTSFPDEKVFMIYPQTKELYFKLVLLEIDQITEHPNIDETFFIDGIDRIILLQ